jgi:hypothetical protein
MWRTNRHVDIVTPKPMNPKTTISILITGYNTLGRMPQRSSPYTECQEFRKSISNIWKASMYQCGTNSKCMIYFLFSITDFKRKPLQREMQNIWYWNPDDGIKRQGQSYSKVNEMCLIRGEIHLGEAQKERGNPENKKPGPTLDTFLEYEIKWIQHGDRMHRNLRT